MATYQDGNVRRATPNTVQAMRESAEHRRCPRCGRGSALNRLDLDDVRGSYCRWKDCGYQRLRDPRDETYDEARERWARENPEDRRPSPGAPADTTTETED